MSERGTMGIGVVGLGYWGPNHVRGVMEVPDYDSFGEFQLRLARRRHRDSEARPGGTITGAAEALIRRLTAGEPTPGESDSGVRTVACVEAIQQSPREEGRRIPMAGVAVA